MGNDVFCLSLKAAMIKPATFYWCVRNSSAHWERLFFVSAALDCTLMKREK